MRSGFLFLVIQRGLSLVQVGSIEVNCKLVVFLGDFLSSLKLFLIYFLNGSRCEWNKFSSLRFLDNLGLYFIKFWDIQVLGSDGFQVLLLVIP